MKYNYKNMQIAILVLGFIMLGSALLHLLAGLVNPHPDLAGMLVKVGWVDLMTATFLGVVAIVHRFVLG